MMAVSSFRPLAECSADIASNQIIAHRSWSVFERVIYFSEPEILLDGPGTEFRGGKERPSIRTLAQTCASLPGWSAIINSDIFIGEKLPHVEMSLNRVRATCAISRRYEMSQCEARVKDNGLDFFAAKPEVWSAIARAIPPVFQLGKVKWDSWTLNFMVKNWPDQCWDITLAQIVFHPRHGERRDREVVLPDDPYLRFACWTRNIMPAS